VLIADPQLVDPHTYPGRPWPLSTMTVWYTDLYLRRSYRLLQEHLEPETLFFLGDLFDGGREWATRRTASPEKKYKKYGNQFWMKEYSRFMNIFLRGWKLGSRGSPHEPRGRKIVSSLAGNHDLGFANGIKLAVRDRFDAFFGPLNRIDVIGNHTFISLDTLSLSAMDQVDPVTGSSGLGDGTSTTIASSALWKPVEQFLTQAKDAKARAVQREHLILSDASEAIYSQNGLTALEANVSSLQDAPPIHKAPSSALSASFPTILLTHVPLYRPPETPCGPLREYGNALSITAGHQYQNVLTPLVSKSMISKLGASEVVQVYSGDDHDYCEIEHLEFTGRIKEITVKSMSWAMGVRRPGFLAVSLHNPINLTAAMPSTDTDPTTPKDTIQNRLCLLPDQLAIFIRYAQLLTLTLTVLVVRALVCNSDPSFSPSSSKSSDLSLLPVSEPKFRQTGRERSCSSSQTSSVASNTQLSTRSAARSSSPSKLGGYGDLPASSRSSSPLHHVPFLSRTRHPSKDWSTKNHDRRARQRSTKFHEFKISIYQVAFPVLAFYFWLIWIE